MKCTTTKLLFCLCLLISHSAQSAKFSIVVLPDTQWYAAANSPVFQAQTQWVKDNRVKENIIYVAHLGDLKDGLDAENPEPNGTLNLNCDNKNLAPGAEIPFYEWDYVARALNVLEAPSIDPDLTGLPAGIPYSIVPGNHDFNNIPDVGCPNYKPDVLNGRPLGLYNNKLGDSHFSGRGYYGGTRPVDSIEIGVSPEIATGDSFTNFDYCGIDFIAINLGYREMPVGSPNALDVATANPEIGWADDLLESNPNRLGILTSHFFLWESGNFGSWPNAVYDELNDNSNLFMMLSGHRFGEAWRTDSEGRENLQPVQAILSNYQSINYPVDPANANFENLTTGGARDSGFMRIMRFDTDTGMVNVETFSPAIPVLSRATLVSDYFPTDAIGMPDPAGMNTRTASNFSFSFQNYGTTNFTCTTPEPVDIELILDRSDSMNDPSNGPEDGTKLEAIQAAVNMFIDIIKLDEVHRIGFTQFNNDVTPFVTPFPFDRLNENNDAAAKVTIDSVTASGETDIIEAVQAGVGVEGLDFVSDYPNSRRSVVLFTDGQHNSPSTLTDPELQTALETEIDAIDPDIEFYSIGFGADISDVALNGTAQSHNGFHLTEVDSLFTAKDFALVAANLIDSEVLLDPVFTILAGQQASETIGVSEADSNITFVLHWDRYIEDNINSTIIPPDANCPISNSDANANTRIANGINYRIIRVNLPYSCNGNQIHSGDWTVNVEYPGNGANMNERVAVLAFASSDINLDSQVSHSKGIVNLSAALTGENLGIAEFSAYILPPIPQNGGSVERTPIIIDLNINTGTPDNIEATGNFVASEQGLHQVRIVATVTDSNGQKVRRETVASIFVDDMINLVGQPVVNRSSETGVFVWRTLNGRTIVQVTAGDPAQNNQTTDFEGNIVSGSVITALTPIGIEPSDSLSLNGFDRIDFDLLSQSPWDDRFSFIADQTQSLCITLDAYAGGLFLGPDKVEVTPPYDIHALLGCASPQIDFVGMPDIDRSSETGMFIWRNPNNDGINVSAVAGGLAQGGLSTPFAGSVASDQPISALQQISIEATDTVNLNLNNDLIDFEMFAISPWEDRFIFNAATSQSVCITLDAFAGGLFIGPNKVEVSSPFDLITLTACDNGPVIETMGGPTIDRSTDVGIFIWENTVNEWRAEVVSGDGPRVIQVDVNSTQSISSNQINIEPSDVFTQLSNGINMRLNVNAPWMDGFIFTNQPLSNTCVSTTNLDVPIFLGPNRVNVGNSLNLDTLMSCP